MSKLIAIDDGHGMETPGKQTFKFPDGTIMKENEFNSAVVNYLKEYLNHNGFDTLLVAPTDKDTPLEDRVKLANSKKADLYISIHADAFGVEWNQANGFTVFVYKFGGEAEKLARIVNKHLASGTPQTNRGVKEANFYVLRKTNMPAILIESGFMTNLKEAQLLKQDSFRKECAKEIAQAICEYYGMDFKDLNSINLNNINIKSIKVLEKTSNTLLEGIIINNTSFLQVNELKKINKSVVWNPQKQIVEIEL